jgi:hypothetical protein
MIPLACASAQPDGPLAPSPAEDVPTEEGFPGSQLDAGPEWLGASCDLTRSVTSTGLPLIVRDRSVLARFELRRVLAQILATANHPDVSPEVFLQRLFDTENASSTAVFPDVIHCDTPGNSAFVNGPPTQCPRAEGALARSKGLLSPGDADYFEPVALIHRFDLMSASLATCGEYRILYAKSSGRTDPNNRVLLILEAALANPQRSLAACRPMADRLARWEKDVEPGRVADDIEKAYFVGGDGLRPIVHAESYGFKSSSCTYAGECGQVRIGQGMQAPWEFRELRLVDDATPFQLRPVTVKSSPVPALFGASTPPGDRLRSALLFDLRNLAGPTLPSIASSLGDDHNGGESALIGDAAPDYVARVSASSTGTAFMSQIGERLAGLSDMTCPTGDPLTPTAILRRSSGLSCAGCHAPEKFLSADRAIGCGLTWPKSLGETHIDENGNLSEALTGVFLPHRARVLTTYLQACDAGAIRKNLVPSFGGNACFVAGTAITLADGTKKPIERIAVGDLVLSYDEKTATLANGLVTRTFVHANTDHLVVVNGTLTATANHPFYSAGRWVPAEELFVGSNLFDGRTVSAIEMKDGTSTTYNFEVADYHDYFAGGFLVHNKK